MAAQVTEWTGKHGRSAYANGKCFCEVCTRDATLHANMQRSRRRAYVAEYGVPHFVEHGRSCYVNWGCRCDICKAGNKTSK